MELNDLVRLTNNVWIYPHSEQSIQPNIGIITTKKSTILIDCGNSPKHAKNIEQSLQKIGAPPVEFIIYSHHHWDHTFGSSYFNGTFISHELCYNHLKSYSGIKWNKKYLEKEIEREPLLEGSNRKKMELIQDWESFKIILPNITFKNEITLHLGETTLELSYIGGRHANDSILVKELESNVIFVGDCFYPPSLHLRKEGDTYDLDILKKLEQEAADVYVHGHGEPANLKELKDIISSIEQD
ncbi:MBL fold metallo-hydrolase [Virgibacillus siamensis]|uniref:MBL fold metallo-hydrolase n=1 Tax=Virgibacillus siamensis TaxID=480071 RepID=UPI000987C09C|nr:MBL fold metallo-hydrolase [Virgibacillus siamensis]